VRGDPAINLSLSFYARKMYHRTMRPLVRPVAFFLSFVLLQLVLVESGYVCRMPANGPVGASDMAGMQMPGRADHSPTAPAQHDKQDAPCRFPWAPNGCQAMAPCAPAAVTVASAVIASFAPAANVLPQLVALAPPALTMAPELPPPRA
jgi:hypothetical protein